MKTSHLLLAALFLSTRPLFAEDAPKPSPAATPAAATIKVVTADEAQKLLKDNPKVIVLDVRTADEFKAGHIAGAKNIDVMSPDFAKQVATLDKGQVYLIHCAAGGRSTRACALPEVKALPSLYHMNEGFKAWEKSGKPVETTAPAK
jgi:rhodanese-related sulfurtransferase